MQLSRKVSRELRDYRSRSATGNGDARCCVKLSKRAKHEHRHGFHSAMATQRIIFKLPAEYGLNRSFMRRGGGVEPSKCFRSVIVHKIHHYNGVISFQNSIEISSGKLFFYERRALFRVDDNCRATAGSFDCKVVTFF